MSYRMYVNDTQLFGNNESYKKWDDYLKSKGLCFTEDGNVEGCLDDFMEALSVIEEITEDLATERDERIKKGLAEESMFSLESERQSAKTEKSDYMHMGLLGKLQCAIKDNYCFLPYQFYKACRNSLEPAKHPIDGRFDAYVLKPGRRIRISAR